MLRTAIIYGFALAAGAIALQWLEYQIWARTNAATLYIALIAVAFLGIGIWLGRRLFHREPRTAIRGEMTEITLSGDGMTSAGIA